MLEGTYMRRYRVPPARTEYAPCRIASQNMETKIVCWSGGIVVASAPIRGETADNKVYTTQLLTQRAEREGIPLCAPNSEIGFCGDANYIAHVVGEQECEVS